MVFTSNLLDLKSKKILITGGSGFFGKNLCSYLNKLNKDHNLNLTIYAMARNHFEQDSVIFVKEDLTKEINFNETVDYIIHAATPVVNDSSTSDELLDVIINGSQRVAQLALKLKTKKLLLISSGAAYGTQPFEIEKLEESYSSCESIYNPNNAYGSGKSISEIVVGQILNYSGVEYVVARGFAFSGDFLAFDQHFAIGNFIKSACDEKVINIQGDGSAVRSYMDSDDLKVWVMTMLLRGQNREIYNLGSDQEISIKDLAYKVAKQIDGTVVNILNKNSKTIKKNRYVPSIQKANKELGLGLTVSLDESIKKMIVNYRNTK